MLAVCVPPVLSSMSCREAFEKVAVVLQEVSVFSPNAENICSNLHPCHLLHEEPLDKMRCIFFLIAAGGIKGTYGTWRRQQIHFDEEGRGMGGCLMRKISRWSRCNAKPTLDRNANYRSKENRLGCCSCRSAIVPRTRRGAHLAQKSICMQATAPSGNVWVIQCVQMKIG